MAKRGRPCLYLTVIKWELFLNNHWKHMIWKVNTMIGLMIIIVGMLVAILAAAITKLFG